MRIDELINKCNKSLKCAIENCFQNDSKATRAMLFDCMEHYSDLGKIVSPRVRVLCEKRLRELLDCAKEVREMGCSEGLIDRMVLLYEGDKAEIVLIPSKSQTANKADISPAKEKINAVKEQLGGIRPLTLSDYEGQETICGQLRIAINAAKGRNECLQHVLFYGSAGLGKTTISQIIANEMGGNFIEMNGATLKDVEDFLRVIQNIKKGDIIFIDEIHAMPSSLAESIYSALEDYKLSYIKGKGDTARSVTLNLPHFTFIGATTHSGKLTKPLLDRFTYKFRLELYSVETLIKIAAKTAFKFGYRISEDAALSVAEKGRGIPRIVNNYIKGIRDVAQLKNAKDITRSIANEYFESMQIDNKGLTTEDRLILSTILNKFNGGPVGLKNLSSATGEGENIIENQIEPYLIYLGFLKITANGRVITENGKQHIQ